MCEWLQKEWLFNIRPTVHLFKIDEAKINKHSFLFNEEKPKNHDCKCDADKGTIWVIFRAGDSRAGMMIIVDAFASKNIMTPANPWDNTYHLNIALIHEAGGGVSGSVEHVLLSQLQSKILFLIFSCWHGSHAWGLRKAHFHGGAEYTFDKETFKWIISLL